MSLVSGKPGRRRKVDQEAEAPARVDCPRCERTGLLEHVNIRKEPDADGKPVLNRSMSACHCANGERWNRTHHVEFYDNLSPELIDRTARTREQVSAAYRRIQARVAREWGLRHYDFDRQCWIEATTEVDLEFDPPAVAVDADERGEMLDGQIEDMRCPVSSRKE